MSEEQYLLNQLAEECCELAIACHKASRFGLDDDFHSDPEKRPRAMIEAELVDVCALMRLLRKRGILESDGFITDKIEAKFQKVSRFMEYSRGRGRLT